MPLWFPFLFIGELSEGAVGGALIILSPAGDAEGAEKGGQVGMMDIGLLLNFGMNTMKEGIVCVVNNDHPSASSAVSAEDKTN